LTIGRAASATNIRGSSIITTGNFTPVTNNTDTIGTSTLKYNNGFFTNLTPTSIDAAGALPLTIGGTVQNSLTLGRTGATTNLRGSSIVTTGSFLPGTTNTGTIGTSAFIYNSGFFTTLNTPTLDTATAVAQNIGTSIQTGLTLGRVGAPTTINSSVLTLTGTITGSLNPTVAGVTFLGIASQPWANVNTNGLTLNNVIVTAPAVRVYGNWIPNDSSYNLGSATNRWNVFAQTLTLPNTAGVPVTNYVSISSTTISNTLSIGDLFGAGNGSLSVTDAAGVNRRAKCSGILSSLAGSTLSFNLSSGTQVAFLNTYTMVVSTNVPFILEIDYSIRSPNSYIAFGKFQYGTTTPQLFQYTTTNNVGIGTYNLRCYWSLASTSNSITSNNAIFETLA
jgi:hypothetical protein